MDVSLILPVYGAEGFLAKNLSEIDRTLSQSNEKWELVLVVDASPDASESICREFASQPRPYPIKVLVNPTNLGKGASVKRGILAAAGRYRIFNDCDLAYPMTEVLKILMALKNRNPIAIASRSCPDSRFIFAPENFRYLYTRHVASKSLNFLIGRLFLPQFKDTQAGLKGFTAATAEFIFSQLHLSGFSFDLEILHLAHQAGLSICEVPINFYAQRVSTINFPLELFRMLRDIGRIYYWTVRNRYNFVPSLPLIEETVRASAVNRAGKI